MLVYQRVPINGPRFSPLSSPEAPSKVHPTAGAVHPIEHAPGEQAGKWEILMGFTLW